MSANASTSAAQNVGGIRNPPLPRHRGIRSLHPLGTGSLEVIGHRYRSDPLFVVASETGGQVLGAFQGADLIGFTLAICGWREENLPAFPYDRRHAGTSRFRHRSPAEALSEGRRTGTRHKPCRVDFRSSGNQKFLFQFHAPRCDCSSIHSQRLRNHDQSPPRIAAHGPTGCRMASPLGSGEARACGKAAAMRAVNSKNGVQHRCARKVG